MEKVQENYKKAMAGTPTVIIDPNANSPSGFYVVKYSNELRVYLEGLDADAAARVAQEFGLPFYDKGEWDPKLNPFFDSSAFKGLQEWVEKHPRRAKRFSLYGESYIPGWYKKAGREVRAFACNLKK